MPLRAVIFDVDGVLVQSMERHHEAYQRAFQPLGIDITREEVFAQEGRRSREVVQSLAEARGLSFPKEKLDAVNEVKKETFMSFGPQPLYPGVEELLGKLKGRGLKLAFVTGTTRHNAGNHLRGVMDRFDAAITADDVKHTKPHPEPYLTALRKLGVEAQEALVVENATLGIQAARAAGIRVVGVASTLKPEQLVGADQTVPRITDVWSIVEGMA